MFRFFLRLLGLPRVAVDASPVPPPAAPASIVRYSWPTFRRGAPTGRVKTRWFVVTALLLALFVPRHLPAQAAMSFATARELFQAARAYEPPAAYRGWWAEVLDRCQRIARGCRRPAITFEQVEWFEMPDDFVCDRDGNRCLAAVIVGSGQALIARSVRMNKRIVEHEMLHLILGIPDHGPEFDWLDLRAPGAA